MDVRCQSLNEFKRLYNFYFRISEFYFGKQSKHSRSTHLFRSEQRLHNGGGGDQLIPFLRWMDIIGNKEMPFFLVVGEKLFPHQLHINEFEIPLFRYLPIHRTIFEKGWPRLRPNWERLVHGHKDDFAFRQSRMHFFDHGFEILLRISNRDLVNRIAVVDREFDQQG